MQKVTENLSEHEEKKKKAEKDESETLAQESSLWQLLLVRSVRKVWECWKSWQLLGHAPSHLP